FPQKAGHHPRAWDEQDSLQAQCVSEQLRNCLNLVSQCAFLAINVAPASIAHRDLLNTASCLYASRHHFYLESKAVLDQRTFANNLAAESLEASLYVRNPFPDRETETAIQNPIA